MNERTIMIIMSILTVGFAGITAFSYMVGDHTAPEINFPDTEITYIEGSDTTPLLQGVSAKDDKNGDVSQYVCIDSIVPNSENGTATVVYAAYDFSNNVAKAKRTVQYISEEGDTDDLDSQALEETTDLAQNENIGDVEESVPDEAQVVDPTAPVLTMAEHAFTIEEGGPFTPKNRVLSVEDDVDSSDYLMSHLKVDGDYDIDTAGVYELDYYVVDSDGKESNHEKMVLTVEKAGRTGQNNANAAATNVAQQSVVQNNNTQPVNVEQNTAEQNNVENAAEQEQEQQDNTEQSQE